MMTDLFEKSIATLELPRVLEQLAACASTQEGKERCLSLRPMTDPDDVQRAQEETSAAVEMLIKRGSPGFSGVKPVGASLHRADMGGSLNTRELLEVAAVLRCARTVQDYGAGEEKTELAFRYGAALGAAFQIRDDMLDVLSTEAELGKPIGSDAEEGKLTFMSLYGEEKCEQMVRRITELAVSLAKELGSDFLAELALRLSDRRS